MNRRERILGGVVLAGIGGVSAFLIVLSVTDQRLSARLAGFEPPESVCAYEAQVEEIVARLDNAEPLDPHDLDTRNALSERVAAVLLLRRLQNAMDGLLESHRDTAFMVAFHLRYEDGFRLAPGEEPTVEVVSALLHDAEEILAGIHDLADRDFVTMAADPDASWLSFPGPFYVNCASIIAASAAYHSYTSQARAAFEDIQAGLKISHTLFDEPVLEVQRAAVEMASAMAQMLPSAFDPGNLPGDWLDELLPELRPPDSQQMLLDALAARAANAVSSRGEIWADRSLVEWVDERGVYWGARNWLWRKPICRPMTNLDDRSLLEIGDRIMSVPDVSYHEMRPYLEAIADYGESLSIVCHNGKRFASSFMRPLERMAQAGARMDIAALGLRIEHYYKDHGVYPPGLDSLRNGAAPNPTDPITGDAYRYVAGEYGFLLYSPGGDAEDGMSMLVEKGRLAGESPSTPERVRNVRIGGPTVAERTIVRPGWAFIDDIVWRPETYVAALVKGGAQAPERAGAGDVENGG